MKDFHTAAAKARQTIATLQAQRRAIERAAPSIDEALAHTRQALAAMTPPHAVDRLANALVAGRPITDIQPAEFMALVFASQRDAILETLTPHIEALCSDGISSTERTAQLAQLSKQLDREERAEEALIVEARAAGIHITRRPDARPEIILES